MVLLYGIHEALGSIPALSKPAVVRTCNSSIAEVEAISLSPLHSKVSGSRGGTLVMSERKKGRAGRGVGGERGVEGDYNLKSGNKSTIMLIQTYLSNRMSYNELKEVVGLF